MLRLQCLSKIKPLFDSLQLISNSVNTGSRHLSCLAGNWPVRKNTTATNASLTALASTLSSSSFRTPDVGNPTRRLSTEGRFFTSWKGPIFAGGFHQNVREYHVKEGSIKWRRRREKAMEQRKQVLHPNSPVIDHLTPLPPHDVDKFPPELFGYQVVRDSVKDQQEAKDVVAEINRQIESKDYGRLFAVINVKGKQFKVTTEDIIILQGHWAPNVGERIRLHKILLVGGADFTMTGRPLLDDGLLRVEGTVIEKTLSYTKLHFRLKKRKNFRRLKLSKDPYTMLRINMIELVKPIEVLQTRSKEVDQTIDANYRVTLNK